MAVEAKQPHSRTCWRPQAGPQAGPRTSGGPSPRQVSATSRALPESLDKVPVYPIDGERVEIISPRGTCIGPQVQGSLLQKGGPGQKTLLDLPVGTPPRKSGETSGISAVPDPAPAEEEVPIAPSGNVVRSDNDPTEAPAVLRPSSKPGQMDSAAHCSRLTGGATGAHLDAGITLSLLRFPCVRDICRMRKTHRKHEVRRPCYLSSRGKAVNWSRPQGRAGCRCCNATSVCRVFGPGRKWNREFSTVEFFRAMKLFPVVM